MTTRPLAYSAGLLLAFATALPAYLSSSFLAERLSETTVGGVYALAAGATLILLSAAPALARRLPLQILVLGGGLLSGAAALTLAADPERRTVIAAFVIFYALTVFLRLLVDFYLEQTTDNKSTGTVRGLFLTLINLGWLFSPFLAATLVNNGGYRLLFIVAGLLFLPLGLLVIKHREAASVRRENVWRAFITLLKPSLARRRNLRRILLVDLWLNIFYALMVIYMPIYLHQHVGLDWPAIGIIFTWMLLPFVLLDYPLGWLADKKWGEKEILATGLVIAGLATIVASTLAAPVVILWSVVLFTTRVGAASIEIMKETYLFKKIDGNDLDILSLSRNLIPLAYLIGPVIALVVLAFFPLNYLFTFLGLSAFLLLPPVWKLADTK